MRNEGTTTARERCGPDTRFTRWHNQKCNVRHVILLSRLHVIVMAAVVVLRDAEDEWTQNGKTKKKRKEKMFMFVL